MSLILKNKKKKKKKKIIEPVLLTSIIVIEMIRLAHKMREYTTMVTYFVSQRGIERG